MRKHKLQNEFQLHMMDWAYDISPPSLGKQKLCCSLPCWHCNCKDRLQLWGLLPLIFISGKMISVILFLSDFKATTLRYEVLPDFPVLIHTWFFFGDILKWQKMHSREELKYIYPLRSISQTGGSREKGKTFCKLTIRKNAWVLLWPSPFTAQSHRSAIRVRKYQTDVPNSSQNKGTFMLFLSAERQSNSLSLQVEAAEENCFFWPTICKLSLLLILEVVNWRK